MKIKELLMLILTELREIKKELRKKNQHISSVQKCAIKIDCNTIDDFNKMLTALKDARNKERVRDEYGGM